MTWMVGDSEHMDRDSLSNLYSTVTASAHSRSFERSNHHVYSSKCLCSAGRED